MGEKRIRAMETLCARGAPAPLEEARPLAPPVVAASTFAFDDLDAVEAYYEEGRGYLYARYENPTVRAAESFLAALEGAQDAACFASGMAAISTSLLGLVEPGGTVLAQRQVYGGTAHLLRDVLPARGIQVRTFDATEGASLDPARLEGVSWVYAETPTNPTLRIVDLERLVGAAHRAGARVMVDATFATPIFQRTLELGADLVIHSGTKYLGGHSDLIAGVVASDLETIRKLKLARRIHGGCLDPFAAFLLHRGMRTLSVRMQAHEARARAVAAFLEGHPRVRRVFYPGLPGHPDHALAVRQMQGFGGMVSFEPEGGAEAARRIHDRLRLFVRAASLGGVESLVTLPARTSHRGLGAAELEGAGVDASLVRLSVGLESPEDLVEDLAQALG